MFNNRFGERGGRTPEDAEFAELLERAHEKAEELLNAKSVDMNAFKGIYSEEKIRIDEAKVADYEKKFAAADSTEQKRRDKKLATVMEALFLDRARRRGGWLGEGAQVLPASKLDDYQNGVDCITEYKRGNTATYLAMAIDATWSSSPYKKFDRIRDDLSRGKLGKIEYLEADGKPQRGKEVPRVVVGASEQTLREVIKLWVDGDEAALEKHPIQLLFLQEIVDELEECRTFSEKRKHAKNVAVFDEYLAILKPILEEKKQTIQTTETFENDTVRNGIKASLFALNYERPMAA
jgi:hypothetical protein